MRLPAIAINALNPLRCATLTVADPAATAALYARWLGYGVVEHGALDPALARSWGAEASAHKRFAVLRPASGARVDVRLVQGRPVPGYRPLRSHGWAAIELCVQDVLALHAQLQASPFDIIGPPSANPSLPAIHPMQVRGPDGEIVYLTQVKQGGPGSGLPTAGSAVDALFIAVLACADMRATARWFATQLGWQIDPDITLPYRMLNQAFGLPPGQLHTLATGTAGGAICIEFDQLPPAATPRPRHAGQLPPGVALCSVLHAHLLIIPGPWLSLPLPRPGAVYEGRRVGVLRSPEGALLEVIEAGPAPAP